MTMQLFQVLSDRNWPSDDQNLLLRSVLAPPKEARLALERWCQRNTLDEIDSSSYFLLPQLYLRRGLFDDLPLNWHILAGIRRQAWARNQQILHATLSAIALLDVEPERHRLAGYRALT